MRRYPSLRGTGANVPPGASVVVLGCLVSCSSAPPAARSEATPVVAAAPSNTASLKAPPPASAAPAQSADSASPAATPDDPCASTAPPPPEAGSDGTWFSCDDGVRCWEAPTACKRAAERIRKECPRGAARSDVACRVTERLARCIEPDGVREVLLSSNRIDETRELDELRRRCAGKFELLGVARGNP